MVEQQHAAILEVLRDGASSSEVAMRFGVRRHADIGLAGLTDRSPRPVRCPHQMPAEVAALVVEL